MTVRNRSLRPALSILTLVAVALLVGSWLILSTVSEESTQRQRAIHSVQIADALNAVARDAVNAESGQRGYFITLDERYLAPYHAANQQYPTDMARLELLYADNLVLHTAAEHQIVASIRQTVEAKFSELRDTLDQLEQHDLFGAQRRILSFEGQAAMERLNGDIMRLRSLENARLSSSNAGLLKAESALAPEIVVLITLIVVALGLGVSLTLRTAHAEAGAAHADALGQAYHRADLLAQEMNHRVKNLLAMVLALIKMSSSKAPESAALIQTISDRIRALLKSHEATQGDGHGATANVDKLIETVIAPYRSDDTACKLTGPEVALQTQQAVSFGLMLHELATNAVKYGAWSRPGGTINIEWQCDAETPRQLHLVWRERSPVLAEATTDAKPGFGSMLLDGSARQLGGTCERIRYADGMEVKISIALDRSAAI